MNAPQKMPKYQPFQPFSNEIRLENRRWPDTPITRAPRWMSTDLRDGNQALFEPMDSAHKLALFKMLVDIGFKEIEVAFPSASQTEFDFVRTLIEGGHIPEDVTIEVLTQARPALIERTFEALRGAQRAIVHVYNPVAPTFRRIVFQKDPASIIALATAAARQFQALAKAAPETDWVFEYTPEVFSSTELPFALAICNAVTEIWQPTPEQPCIINLPATVEMSSPNLYADQIEWMHRHLARRQSIILSIHPHNDRGCAVAAAELALMAGADRVEGCLFGNGERTGNVDLVTLALNLTTQGIDSGLDFSKLSNIARQMETFTQLPIHPRHPYAGDLVFTAFSGSHQDAIKKGLAVQQADQPWEVPYLPIDPADIGRDYDAIIRVNSQSGKGGIAYLLEAHYGIVLPRRLQIALYGIVQQHADATGRELSAAEIYALFEAHFGNTQTPIAYQAHHLFESENLQGIRLTIRQNGQAVTLEGSGNGPISATVAALKRYAPLHVSYYEERALATGENAQAIAYVEAASESGPGTVWGVGIHENVTTASILAVIAAANQCPSRETRL